jgi:hypothetical protein
VPSRVLSAAAARSTAQPFTTPHGSSAGSPASVARHTANAPPDSRSAARPRSSTSWTSGGQSATVTSPRRSRETQEPGR